jgi:CRISPR/Cas system-associated protein Csm6
MPSNYSLGSVESTEDSAGDEALLLELISAKGRRCCACLGGMVVMMLLVVCNVSGIVHARMPKAL